MIWGKFNSTVLLCVVGWFRIYSVCVKFFDNFFVLCCRSILFCTHVLGYTPLNEFGDHFYAYFFFENIFIIRSLDSFANPFIYYALSANLREAFYDHATKNCRPKPTTANPSNARGMSTMTSRQFGTTTSLGASNYEMHSTAQNGKISASNLSEGPKRKELKLGVGVITQNEENFSRV